MSPPGNERRPDQETGATESLQESLAGDTARVRRGAGNRVFIRSTAHNEHQAEWMPDDCHDVCAERGICSIYFPFHWCHGLAWYLCTEGHLWTCGWSVGQTDGVAPRNAGRATARLYFEPYGGEDR